MKHSVAVGLILMIVIAAGVIGCGGSKTASTATMSFGPTTPSTAALALRPPPGVPITAARASDDLFSIFPGSVAVRACRIPHGGPPWWTMALPGTCVTRLAYDQERVIVSFTEWWGGVLNHARSRRVHGSHHHTWQVILNPARKVVAATLSTGAIAPQYWR